MGKRKDAEPITEWYFRRMAPATTPAFEDGRGPSPRNTSRVYKMGKARKQDLPQSL